MKGRSAYLDDETMTTMPRLCVRLAACLPLCAVLAGACGGARSDETSGPPPPRQGLASQIDALATTAIEEGSQPGISIAVAREGTVLLAKGYGYADVEGRVRAAPSTVYRIGSVTKQFTAAAIMDLAERGHLGVDDEVTKFLPDYPTQRHRLTVRHLLNHTSGIKGYTEERGFAAIADREAPREELVKLFAGKFNFAPGQRWEYSNSNYYLLGLIIEKVSGAPTPTISPTASWRRWAWARPSTAPTSPLRPIRPRGTGPAVTASPPRRRLSKWTIRSPPEHCARRSRTSSAGTTPSTDTASSPPRHTSS